ncbi:MAG TPA: hypothetical protein VHM00_17945 [Caldimonas sp.]|jgi:hypothetical protein|nr:hypothetical protein [Caldimonas sp.]HEX2542950.1 hypothetical protein [Caldimonas sp.]
MPKVAERPTPARVRGSLAFTVESCLKSDPDADMFWMQTSLVDLRWGDRPNPAADLRGRMKQVRERAHACSDADGLGEFRRWMMAGAAPAMSLVLLVPDRDPESFERVKVTLMALLENTWRRVALLAVVARDPSSWGDLLAVAPSVIRIVHSGDGPGQLEVAANAMFLACASLHSQVLLTCTDYEDIDACLGDAGAPGRLVIADWNAESQQLHVEPSDAAALQASSRAFVAPLWPDATMRSLSSLSREIRHLGGRHRDLVVSASTEFFNGSDSPPRSSMVVVACRP